LRRSRPAGAVLVLRDPANWLASSLAHGRASPEELVEKRDRLIQYLEHALGVKDHLGAPAVAVDFPRFTVDASYRAALAVTLDLTALEAAEAALDAVPSFGGGSSFGPRGAGHPP